VTTSPLILVIVERELAALLLGLCLRSLFERDVRVARGGVVDVLAVEDVVDGEDLKPRVLRSPGER
jgi:hypothetical protein